MTVIGLDLSLNAPGLCVSAARAESLKLDPKDGDLRLSQIRDWLAYYVARWQHQLAVIEAVPPYAPATASLERVHGVAREVLARHGVPFAYVSATALKLFATDNGQADKQAMMRAAEIRATDAGWKPADDNQADAWWLRRMGEWAMRPDCWADLEPHELRAMSSVAWPLAVGPGGTLAPYGELRRKPVTKKCGHKVIALKSGDQWLHPFTVAVCDKPPK